MDQMKMARRNEGFSLIELLVVVAILVIVAVMAMPAFNSIVFSSNLNRAGLMLSDQFTQARQEAITKNRMVEFRIYHLPDDDAPDTKGWRAVQAWTVQGTNLKPVSRLTKLPKGIVIVSNTLYSPLLTAGSLTGEADLPPYGTVSYKGFRIRPTGVLEDVTGSNAVFTLKNARDADDLPSNHYTLQINPFTGKASVFRP